MNFKHKYYSSLDGLRAIAALGVIMAHFFSANNIGNYPILLRITALGNSGVSLFFVLSGFVITRILLQSRGSHNYFKSFYARRILRIFPLYYFSLICYYYLPYLLFSSYNAPKFFDQLYFWSYLQNIARTFNWHSIGPGHFWSLAVEEHFYLMWPAIIYFAFRKNINTLLFTSIILFLIPLLLRYFMLGNGLEIDVFTLTRLDQLTLGGILAILEIKGFLDFKQLKYYISIFLAGLVLIALTSTLDEFNMNLYKHYAFGTCYFGLIAVSAISPKGAILNKLLSLRIMQYLGKISYGIYVWHVLAMDIVNRYFLTNFVIVDFISVLLTTITISALSFKFLEKPFLDLKRYFSYGEIVPATEKIKKVSVTGDRMIEKNN